MKTKFVPVLLLSLLTLSLHSCQSSKGSISIHSKSSKAATSGKAPSKTSPNPSPQHALEEAPDIAAKRGEHSIKHEKNTTVFNPPLNAILKSQEAQSQINIRSAPSTASKALHYGLGGDSVVLLKSSETHGEIWFFVRFVVSQSTGWVRSDFVHK